MQISINMPDSVILSLAKIADKEGRAIEDLIIERCTEADDLLCELSDSEIDKQLKKWFEFAVKEFKDSESFTLQQLVQACEGRGVWVGYSVVTRKKMGKRLKALIDEDFLSDGYCLASAGKTVTNAALYLVRPRFSF